LQKLRLQTDSDIRALRADFFKACACHHGPSQISGRSPDLSGFRQTLGREIGNLHQLLSKFGAGE